MKVAVFGVGYVGLTMIVHMGKKGMNVFGIDINKGVIDSLNKGKIHILENGLQETFDSYREKLSFFEKTPNEKFDVIIVTVGTPVPKDKPDFSAITSVANEISKLIKGGELIIFRSTVSVGTTRNIVLPILEKSGKEFYLAFCPERTLEGKALKELEELPQIIGGLNRESEEKAVDFFLKLGNSPVILSSLESAELVKLLNNNYRMMCFAFANEIAEACEVLNLDSFEIIKSANKNYPRSNIPLPGLTGGPCLPKDTIILQKSFEGKKELMIPKVSYSINMGSPFHIANIISKNIDRTSKIILSGMAFKGRPVNGDLRGSLSLDLFFALKEKGFENIFVHDFEVLKSELEKISNIAKEEDFRNSECVIIANNHPKYDASFFDSLPKKIFLVDIWALEKENSFKYKKYYAFGVGNENCNC